jgi:hypothetical protein
MTSTDALIQELSADLAPVQRRSIRREAAALMILGAGELALILMSGAMRPDMARVIVSPYMAWKIGGLAVLAVASCTAAIRSFAPSALWQPGRMFLPILAGLFVIGGVFVTNATDSSRSMMDRLSPAHGILCTAAIVLLSLPVMALLAVLMRRAAPVRPAQSAWIAGIAASTCGALIFTACCPVSDPLYIIAWYSAGIAIVTAAARWLLARRFRL